MADRPSAIPWQKMFIPMADFFILSLPIIFMIGATTTIGKILRAILSVPLAFALCLGSAHYAGRLPGFEPFFLLATVATAIFWGTSMLPPSPVSCVYAICSIPITMAIWNTVLYRAGLGHREWMFTICVGQSQRLWSCEVSSGPCAIAVDAGQLASDRPR
ncbi:hypothetical protein DFH06DRAFT_1223651 [Mycena polygramma]|nr:hypothetical protein DFH06DRAFT_1223651 [Mycena polygramma]